MSQIDQSHLQHISESLADQSSPVIENQRWWIQSGVVSPVPVPGDEL